MFKKFTTPGFNSRFHLQLLKSLLIAANLIVLAIYALVRIIFYDIPFELDAEALIVSKLLGLGTVIAFGGCLVVMLADGIDYMMHHKNEYKFPTL